MSFITILSLAKKIWFKLWSMTARNKSMARQWRLWAGFMILWAAEAFLGVNMSRPHYSSKASRFLRYSSVCKSQRQRVNFSSPIFLTILYQVWIFLWPRDLLSRPHLAYLSPVTFVSQFQTCFRGKPQTTTYPANNGDIPSPFYPQFFRVYFLWIWFIILALAHAYRPANGEVTPTLPVCHGESCQFVIDEMFSVLSGA